MRDTVNYLVSRGYALHEEKASYGSPAAAEGEKYYLQWSDSYFVLETVTHQTTGESYFLEIKNHFGMRCTSFPLDSWKFFPNRLEFKFYAQPESGLGLSFVLYFENERLQIATPTDS